MSMDILSAIVLAGVAISVVVFVIASIRLERSQKIRHEGSNSKNNIH